MHVYGADFSGSKDPSGGIFYVRGELDGNVLTIPTAPVPCEDRLDLATAIVDSRGPWGIDFPFSIPREALSALGLADWSALLDWAVSMRRHDFAAALKDRQLVREKRCAPEDAGLCCRVTDSLSDACSPFKRTNPDMAMMLYSGLKLLRALRGRGVRVYPFDAPVADAARVYEVYPSQVWQRLGLPRGVDVGEMVRATNLLFDREIGKFQVRLGPGLDTAESQDAADAVAACIALARSVAVHGLDAADGWSKRLPSQEEGEWEARLQEGILVRL